MDRPQSCFDLRGIDLEISLEIGVICGRLLCRARV